MVDPSILGIPWKRQLWHKWKAVRKVPFRRSWFVGYDLEGNSYWELVDHNNPSRLRRKVSLDKPYFHFSDFKPHPKWMQWLQYTRPAPPTLNDLTEDAKRQMRLKILAKHAEEKWKSVPLKSGQTDKSEDPRIVSAWSGAGATENNIHPDDAALEPPLSDNNNGGRNILSAMQEAELRRQQEPKVYRDHLGQVRTKRQDSPEENTKDNSTNAKAKANANANADANANANNKNQDEPTTASFQPKGRV